MADLHAFNVGDRVQGTGRENARRDAEIARALARLGGGGRQQDKNRQETCDSGSHLHSHNKKAPPDG